MRGVDERGEQRRGGTLARNLSSACGVLGGRKGVAVTGCQLGENSRRQRQQSFLRRSSGAREGEARGELCFKGFGADGGRGGGRGCVGSG